MKAIVVGFSLGEVSNKAITSFNDCKFSDIKNKFFLIINVLYRKLTIMNRIQYMSNHPNLKNSINSSANYPKQTMTTIVFPKI